MPVVFDEVNAEISPERRSDAEPPAVTSPATNPAELADKLRRELAVLEQRRARLSAD
jgi:hypothetical protein